MGGGRFGDVWFGNYGSAARAQLNLNPFSAYYDNVARAAAQNDAEKVRHLVGGGDGNPEPDRRQLAHGDALCRDERQPARSSRS